MSLTVLALADQVHPALYDHFHRERWGRIDLILSSGDLPPGYLDFIASQFNVPLLYVRGNHDSTFPEAEYEGLENAHGRLVTVRGVRIAGFEGSMRYSQSGCQYTEGEMRAIVRRVRLKARLHGAPHIVLTHAPPRGCHEGCDRAHAGFDAFRNAIAAWKPLYLVHGHTHHHYSRETVGTLDGTTVINAFPYHVFTIELPAVVKQEPSIRRRLHRYGAKVIHPVGPGRTT